MTIREIARQWRVRAETAERERDTLRPIVAYVASLRDCDEDKKSCEFDSGPRCNAHGDNYFHADMIAAARAAQGMSRADSRRAFKDAIKNEAPRG